MHTAAEPEGLVARGVTKHFNGNLALGDFSLTVRTGEVHALVGHNGSGKSTFIKILAGFHTADAGEVTVNGQALHLGDALSSATIGLTFVHQSLGLVPELSVLENLHLGKPYHLTRIGKIAWREERVRATAELSEYGLRIDPDDPVGRLSTVERVQVAIVRALSLGDRITVLVLDEPTAALTDREVQKLFATIRLVAARGVAVIYVSHRLDEIPLIADTVSILRDGRLAARGPIGEFDRQRLVEFISAPRRAGVEVVAAESTRKAYDAHLPQDSSEADELALSLNHLSGRVLRGFDLHGRHGEIIGVVGLVGSGIEELVSILAGRVPATSGRMELGGRPVEVGSLARLARAGFRVVIGDKSERIVPDLDVGENAVLAVLTRFLVGGRLRRRQMRRSARHMVTSYRVRPGDIDQRAGSLSGGNQQKLAVARALQAEPDVLLLEEPFHGVDVEGRAEISRILIEEARKGRLMVIVDSDLDEVVQICHRVIVLRAGAVALVAEGPERDKQRLLEACYGVNGALR